uniref:GAL4-like Zn2Cys6 binuclear cluster DNA-binding domain protein n=1 Tax=Chaetomium globosum TaxID=38033 RepID=A0A6B9PLY0_CHAGS|nr:GAL4-like Zn2Cys6 binuclear cluster DNA-binding domain protein [Chaetomium globosum]
MASAEETFFSAARSRRLACDRCHRHKLRCERSSVIVNGGVAVPLGPCKRCLKACIPCQTISGAFTAAKTGDAAPPRRSARDLETDGPGAASPAKRASAPARGPIASTPRNVPDLSHDHTLSSTDSAPFEISAADAAMLDVSNFDFNATEFIDLGSNAGLSPPALIQSPRDHGSWVGDGEIPDRTPIPPNNQTQPQYDDFADDLTCFGTMAPIHDTTPTLHALTHVEKASTESSKSAPERGPREDCSQRLLEIHGLLLNELQGITAADVTDALMFPENGSFSTRTRTGPGPAGGNTVVHRVLFASERLVDLLSILRAADTGSEGGPRGTAMTSHLERRGSNTRPRPFALPTGSYSSVTESSSANHGAKREAAIGPGNTSSFVDLPIVISILTCYVGLLSVYHAIFSHIYETLRAYEPLRAAKTRQRAWTRPGSGPGPKLGTGLVQPGVGYGADAAGGRPALNVLGIRIQLEIMTHMLEQIDSALFGPRVSQVTDGDEGRTETINRGGEVIFGHPATKALLATMLSHEGYDSGVSAGPFADGDGDDDDDDGYMEGLRGCRMGFRTLMGLQKNIRRLLRTNSFG